MKPNGHGVAADEELWTVKDAAKFMRVATNTMYRYAQKKKGGPPVYRIGTVIRLPKQKFLAWLAKGND